LLIHTIYQLKVNAHEGTDISKTNMKCI